MQSSTWNANSIKIEGGEWICKMASMLADRGIPVCAHMGLTPQAINRIGGNFVQGRDPEKHELIINEAKSLEQAGASLLLLECVPDGLTKLIMNEIKLDGLFIAIGHDPATQLFKDQLKMDNEGYLITKPDSTETNIPGVYAAGDVKDKTFRQAVTAAGMGCMAALEAEKHLSHK